jgi:YHS domain-containing protein
MGIEIMNGKSGPATHDSDRVACQVCGRELPVSEALVSEARDYIYHFCSNECLARFEQQARRNFGVPDDDERLS